ncbi:MAG: hypothetical protein AAB861_02850, partial [Patescibacteria group bacterium]
MSSSPKLKKSLFSKKEQNVFNKLNTPAKIQDFLDRMPFNFEEEGETYRSPREVLKAGKAHCFEGAVFAAAALYFHGRKAPLLDLKVSDLKKDADHTVTLFKEGKGKNKRWGAISKTNHAVLRFRDPVYKTVRELTMSYFHEYFLDDGKKTLISFSTPFDIVKKFGEKWITAEEDLDKIALALDKSKHFPIYPAS